MGEIQNSILIKECRELMLILGSILRKSEIK